MTAQQKVARKRATGLKTWTAFGDLGRRPTEYEVLTHGLNHTTGAVPLEMGEDVHGNVWLRKHRDSIGLRGVDWDPFRDPDALTYGSYVQLQDNQETYVEGLLEQFDREDHDADLNDETLAFLARVLTPTRYVAHGQQMLSAYLQQLAVSSYVGNCSAFQTADQLRRVQLTAYRTTQLARTHEKAGFGTSERSTWELDPAWTAIREAFEYALVEFDYDRALVATQLVVKPLCDLLLLDELAFETAKIGSTLDSLLLENLSLDAKRSRRWTIKLISQLVEADPVTRKVLQGYLDEWGTRAEAIVASGARLLASAGVRSEDEVAKELRKSWNGLLEASGLSAPSS